MIDLNIQKLWFKEWMQNPIQIKPNGGYFIINEDSTEITPDDEYDVYCGEVNIINKIKNNEDNYFDFSKNMIDIGSNAGTYSFILPFNHSYCFDGNKAFCILCEMNMLLHNKINKYTMHNVLLSDKKENVIYNGYTCGNENDIYVGDIQNIETHIIDEYNLNNIVFIKIDVEGYEEKVLRGALGTIIRNNYPPILFECWPEYITWADWSKEKRNSLINFLESLGYEILFEWGNWETHLAIHINKLI